MTERPPRAGGRAPSLDLAATTIDPWRLAEHAGLWVLLAFYPHDFGRLCTHQLTGYASIDDELAAADAVLAVVSCDDLATHRLFTEQHGFPFPLLADPDGTAAAAWGVTGPLHTSKRASFVIDPTGVVRDAFVSRTGATWRSPHDLLAVVRTARIVTA
jgi:peroxiredoxin Q/BCP